jgi:hypothetical protein
MARTMRSPPPHTPGTDTASDFTPSPRSSHSSDGLPLTSDPDAYELHVLTPRGQSPARGEEALLRGTRRLSFDSVQSYELYTPDEEKAVLRKLDRRLVAFMALLYCLSFLDRSNIGNARIAGLVDDLGLSSKQYEWLLWAFYITYIAFEWMTLMCVSPSLSCATC